jgi:hypothetical protein
MSVPSNPVVWQEEAAAIKASEQEAERQKGIQEEEERQLQTVLKQSLEDALAFPRHAEEKTHAESNSKAPKQPAFIKLLR